jgi:DNA-directed RNA polymerase specialized sigma24 family protein
MSAADHLTRLYRLAQALGGSRAEELTHEAYARVLPTRPGARTEFGVLARTLLDVLDDERRHRPVARGGGIHAAVADLPTDLRRTVALVDVAHMSYAEAARVLRIPRTTVMTRLHRARSRVAGAPA